jgi:hypothetical protein
MPQSYPEGQRLQGSDGKVYVVTNGVPRAEGSASAPRPVMSMPGDPYKAPTAAADLAAKSQEAELRRIAIEKAKRDLANTPDPAAVVASSGVNGPDYLKSLSPQDAQMVKAIAEGRMQLPANAMRSPYWQAMVGKVVNYDPQFDGINYGARYATRKDFTSGKSAMNIKALNTAIGHLGQLYDQMGGTVSTGGYPGATTVNSIGNAIKRSSGNPGATLYPQTAGAVASELTQVFRGSGGAEADVKRYLEELDPNASLDQKKAAIQNIMGLLKSRLDAIGKTYTDGMGTSSQPLNMLDAHAQHVIDKIMPGGDGGGGSAAGGPSGPGPSPLFDAMNKATFGPKAGGETIDTHYKGVDDPSAYEHYKMLNSMIGAGAPDAAIMAKAMEFGFDPANVKSILDYSHKTGLKNFGFSGNLQRREPLSTSEKVVNSFVANPVTTFAGEGANSFFAGIPQAIAGGIGGDDMRRKIAAARNTNPTATAFGQLAGTAGGATLAELQALKGANALKSLPYLNRALSGEKAASLLPFAARRIADTAFGATSGFSDAQPGNGAAGALGGGLAGLGGGLLGEGVGRYVAEPLTRGPSRMIFGGADKPSPIDMSISKAVGNNSGDVQGALAQARNFDLPMTLADTNPNLRSLAGAAVRRSPTAAGVAENALIPRSRGQIDRFQGAIQRDLGPTANIPQLSDEMIKAARLKAGPLYDQAYNAPPISSPKIDEVLNTPFGQDSLKRAIALAKNERVDPNTLSVQFDAAGDPVMQPTHSTRTLDYVKRGMDDVLEQYRNPITGKLDLGDMGQSQLGVKNDLLKEMDFRNPAYGQARAAYAGPAQEKDWIRRGGDAFKLDPNTLSFNASKIPADKMPLAQLGYRGALSDAGNSVGYGSNPFERTLGTPAAESRLNTMYPDSPGPANLLRQRDLERQMQNTSNDILGNSKTAQRGIADEAFAGEDLPQLAFDVGTNLMMGQVPIGTMVKANLGRRLADAYKLGVGKKAVAKADALAPMLLNTNPAAASDDLAAALARYHSYGDYVARRRGMFGGPAGIVGSGLITGYANS